MLFLQVVQVVSKRAYLDFEDFLGNSDANQRCSACLSRFHICFQCAALPQFPQLPNEVSRKQCVGLGRKAYQASRERSFFEAIGV